MRLAWILCALTLLYAIMFAYLVGDHPAACTCGSSDECAFAASEQAAYDRSTRCRAAYDLGCVVMAFIMGILFALRLTMLLLRLCEGGCGEGKNSSKNHEAGDGSEIQTLHLISPRFHKV